MLIMKKIIFSFKNIILFLFYWLCNGFFMGTLLLMGPVRWLANYSRANDWSESKEKMIVFIFIGFLIIISFICARLLTIKTIETKSKLKKTVLIIVSLLVFLISLWFWMNPKMMIDSNMKETTEKVSGTEFVFGPYPEKEKLIELKKENYTAVISLLSPAVVPFEPVLISQESAMTKEVGIELIHIPMLPWVSANDNIEDKIEEIVKRGDGKYYVHCYLGKDRVNVFKKILSSISKDVKIKSLKSDSIRSLYKKKSFERGDITILDSNVFLTPYPTDGEFLSYIFNGSINSLVCLLNPKNIEDKPWIEKEKTLAEKYKINLVNYSWITLNKNKKDEAMKEILNLEKPIVIHAFNSIAPECMDFIVTYYKTKSK